MNFYVYAYYVQGEENPFYIGRGKGRRDITHIYLCKNLMIITHFYNKLRKILETGFPIIRKLHENLFEDNAIALEIELILQYGRIDIGTGCLCNHTNGGEGTNEHIFISEEVKQKMSTAHLFQNVSTETRCKMSFALTGKKKTNEHKRKIRQSNIKVQGIPICSYSLITNQIIKKYPSIRSVTEDGFTSQGVSAVLCNKRKHYFGYGWRYLSNSEVDFVST